MNAITSHVTPINQSDAYMLYMSCLRVDIDRSTGGRFASAAFDTRELDCLAAAIDAGRLANCLRDVQEQIEWLERLDSSVPEHLRELAGHIGAMGMAAPADEAHVSRALWQRIVLASTAYAIGRMTYIVSWQARLVAASHRRGEIDEATAGQVRSWIEPLRDGQPERGGLGMDFDAAEWLQLSDQLAA